MPKIRMLSTVQIELTLKGYVMNHLIRSQGCLIGGAIGDALGYPIEFMSEESILYKYGPDGLTDYVLINDIAQISDDTQMTLFTADAIICAKNKFPEQWLNDRVIIPYMFHCYQDWMLTQTEDYPLPDITPPYSNLVYVPELFARRAPGTTCMEALRSRQMGSITKPLNDSKGCGGVMRVAPLALALYGKNISPAQTALLGAKAAAITHGHELGYIPAAALTFLIAELLNGISLEDAVKHISPLLISLFPMSENLNRLLMLLAQAQTLAHLKAPSDEAFKLLGQGWVAEETVAIAIYCALKYSNDFEKGVLAAVNHSGDSDSTGSVTGQILGTYLGFEAIPQKYIQPLELKEVILRTAAELARK